MSNRWVFGSTITRTVAATSQRYPLPAGGGTELFVASSAANEVCYVKVGLDNVVASSSATGIYPGYKEVLEILPAATHYAIIGTAGDVVHFRVRQGTASSIVPANFFITTPLTLGRLTDNEGAITTGTPGRWCAYSGGMTTVVASWDMEHPDLNLQYFKLYNVQCYMRATYIATGAPYLGSLQYLMRIAMDKDQTVATGNFRDLFNEASSTGEVHVFANFVYDTKRYLGVVVPNTPQGVRIEITEMVIVSVVPQPNPWDDIPNESARSISINGMAAAINYRLSTPILIPPGETSINVRLTYNGTLDGEITMTATAYPSISDFEIIGFHPTGISVSPYTYHWRPGDDVDLWVTVTILSPRTTTGDQFLLNFNLQGLNALHTGVFFKVDPAGVHQDLPDPMPYHRDPLFLDLTGATPAAEADLENMEWSDSGFVGNATSGTPCWRARLSHGYTQDSGNVGLYVNEDAFPGIAINPISLVVDSNDRPFLRLHSAKFPTPVAYGGKDYYFQSVQLTTQRLLDWREKFGVWQLQAVTPKQSGCWSAFWAIGTRAGDIAQWPPEIDFFEHFNGVYSSGVYTQYETTSTQHVGVHGSVIRSEVAGIGHKLNWEGFAVSHNPWTQIHAYQCVVEEDWITHYVDGIETVRYRNIQRPTDGFPDWGYHILLQVQASAQASNPYTDGSPDMLCYGIHYFDLDSGYTVEPYTATRPYPNLAITPAPDLTSYISCSFVGSGVMAATFASAPFTDDFNRANGDLAVTNPSWTLVYGDINRLTVSSNALSHNAGSTQSCYLSPDCGTTAHFVEATMLSVAADVWGYMICRVYEPRTWVGIRFPGGIAQCFKVIVGGASTSLGATFNFAVNDVIRMEANGTTFTVMKNGITQTTFTVTDAVYQTGTRTGLFGNNGSVTVSWIDNYVSGAL